MQIKKKQLWWLVAFAVLIAGVILPNFLAATSTRSMNACVNNLRQLDGAKQQWMLENRRAKGDAVTWDDIKPYIKTPMICPRGGTYILGRVGELPRCSTGREHTLPPETYP